LLYLIRHAESICNLLQSSTGSVFDELSYDGRQECLKLRNNAKKLREDYGMKIVCSSAGRSLETGVLLFGNNIKIDCDWLETNGGYLRDIPEKYVDNFFKLKNNKDRKYPYGESNYFMKERVIKSFKKYLKIIRNQNIAIVTHLGPILAIAAYLDYNTPKIKNLDGIIISNDDEKYKIITHRKLIQNKIFNTI
tara:strand:+ start:3449 stop:4027 length:579 start_codon:yes stop_codon:yes gene_type:complete